LNGAFLTITFPETKPDVAHNLKSLPRLSKEKIATNELIDEFKFLVMLTIELTFLPN
jgi:hypothetical protein